MTNKIIDTNSFADRFLKLREVKVMTSLGSTTIYKMMNEGRFPRPRQLGPACVRWMESDIEKWMEDLPIRGTER